MIRQILQKYKRKDRVIPGFGLTMGISLLMLSLIILLPLLSVLVYSFQLSPAEFLDLITKDNVEIEITIGSDKAKVNGKNVELDSPAFVENNRTYIPVRFLCESLGAEVEWNASEKKVIIIP